MHRRALLALMAAAGAPLRAQPAEAAVAAASDLQFVLPEVAEAFHRQGAHRVRLSFGSSGNVARQIQQGAPFELFLSADESFALRVADAGLARDRGRLYAIGHLALAVPRDADIALDERLDGLARAWPQVQRFAIANPDLAPYGRAAREALQRLGWWERVTPKLVLGENISQTAQFVATGSAQAGIVSLSLALAPAVAAATRHLRLPATLHAPLRQRMVLLKHASAAATAFHDFIVEPQAQAIFARHGFAPPAAP